MEETTNLQPVIDKLSKNKYEWNNVDDKLTIVYKLDLEPIYHNNKKGIKIKYLGIPLLDIVGMLYIMLRNVVK